MKMLGRLACIAAVVGFGVAPAHALLTITTGGATSDIPGLTGFATTGAMMNGLSIRAEFSGGLDETAIWSQTGATSGAATGSGWGLSLTGDTFGASWNFTVDPAAGLGQLNRLTLDALLALTVFDRTAPSPGTDGSAAGIDFACAVGTTVCTDFTVGARYDFQVNLTGFAAVGDLWQTLTIEFKDLQTENPSGPRGNWSFVQDTDNDARLNQVPEPGSLALLGLGLGAAALVRRRRLQS